MADDHKITSENFIIGSVIKDYPLVRKLSNDYGLNVDHFESATAKEVWAVADSIFYGSIN